MPNVETPQNLQYIGGLLSQAIGNHYCGVGCGLLFRRGDVVMGVSCNPGLKLMQQEEAQKLLTKVQDFCGGISSEGVYCDSWETFWPEGPPRIFWRGGNELSEAVAFCEAIPSRGEQLAAKYILKAFGMESLRDSPNEWLRDHENLRGALACESCSFAISEGLVNSLRAYVASANQGGSPEVPPFAESLISHFLVRVPRLLNSMEEGKPPRGVLAFLPGHLKQLLSICPGDFWDRLRHVRPHVLTFNSKHMTKLIHASTAKSALVCDELGVAGFADLEPGFPCVLFKFFGRWCEVSVADDPKCWIDGDGIHLFNRYEAPEVTTLQRFCTLDVTVQVGDLSKFVREIAQGGHGATLVIAPEGELKDIPMHSIWNPPRISMPEHRTTLTGLSGIDGALLFDFSLKLHGFGAILGAPPGKNVNMARGSRYNSAIAFSEAHPDARLIVVSSDGGVSLIAHGREVASSLYGYRILL